MYNLCDYCVNQCRNNIDLCFNFLPDENHDNGIITNLENQNNRVDIKQITFYYDQRHLHFEDGDVFDDYIHDCKCLINDGDYHFNIIIGHHRKRISVPNDTIDFKVAVTMIEVYCEMYDWNIINNTPLDVECDLCGYLMETVDELYHSTGVLYNEFNKHIHLCSGCFNKHNDKVIIYGR